jgi:hypothetical protein
MNYSGVVITTLYVFGEFAAFRPIGDTAALLTWLPGNIMRSLFVCG